MSTLFNLSTTPKLSHQLVEVGVEEVGHADVTVKEKRRRLNWVRLALRSVSDETLVRQTILVSTAHLTCEGEYLADNVITIRLLTIDINKGCLPPQWYGKNPRINQTENIAKNLLRLANKRPIPHSFESDPLNDLGLVGMDGLVRRDSVLR